MATIAELTSTLQKIDGVVTAAQARGDTAKVQEATADGRHVALAIKQMQAEQASAAPPPATAPHIGGEAAKSIGASTAVGAATGALMPEILTGAGKLAMKVPIPEVKALGAMAVTAGTVMRSMRVASTVEGAVSGALSESAGQISDQHGGGTVQGTLVRFIAGLFSPVPIALTRGILQTSSHGIAAIARKAGASTNLERQTNTAKRTLQSKVVTAQPEVDMHVALLQGIAADKQHAAAHAAQLLATAQKQAQHLGATDAAAAQKVLAEGGAEAKRVEQEAADRATALQLATKGRLATAARVQVQADASLHTHIAPPQEPSFIGGKLQEVVHAQQSKLIQEKNTWYKSQEHVRDVTVTEKEQQGIFMGSTPEILSMRQEIMQKLTPHNGKVEVTDSGIRAAYTRILRAVSNRTETVKGPDGFPVAHEAQPTFNAIDQVRRNLGDIAFGKGEAEGYKALGRQLATEMYHKLSAAQVTYAGPMQKLMQEDYEANMHNLAGFKTRSGKALTAQEAYDPGTFLHDPAGIPGKYFSTKAGVQVLRELTGDSGLVDKLAKAHVARQLQGMGGVQIRGWLAHPSNSDWVRELPGLHQNILAHADSVGKIQRVAGKLEESAKKLAVQAGTVKKAAATQADAARTGALQEATARTASRVDEGQQLVKTATEAGTAHVAALDTKLQGLVKEGFPKEETKRLLLSGTRADLQQASRYLAGIPGGKIALEGAIRNTLATMTPKELETEWAGRILPILEDGQVIKGKELASLKADVERLLKLNEPKLAMTKLQRFMTSLLATGTGAGAAAGMRQVGN